MKGGKSWEPSYLEIKFLGNYLLPNIAHRKLTEPLIVQRIPLHAQIRTGTANSMVFVHNVSVVHIQLSTSVA